MGVFTVNNQLVFLIDCLLKGITYFMRLYFQMVQFASSTEGFVVLLPPFKVKIMPTDLIAIT